MRHCDHSHWLKPSLRDHNVFFTHSNRAQTLLLDLPRAERQSPSLFVLIGNNTKTSALRQLFSIKGKKALAKRAEGEIHLHIDASSIFSDRPILIADGNLPRNSKQSKTFPSEACHETTTKIITRDWTSPPDVVTCADEIYSRLLSPFADVFCFFAVDVGGLNQIALRLASWIEKGRPANLPPSNHPHLIIVTEFSKSEMRDESQILERLLHLLRQETSKHVSSRFCSIRILNLIPEGHISTQARYRKLKEYLMNASDQVRDARRESHTLFSAIHVASFINHAFLNFISTVREPFDFIQTSRIGIAPPDELSEHLKNFLTKIKDPKAIKSFAIPTIASSLLLTTYPPDSHLFCPSSIFQSLYKDACTRAYIAINLEQETPEDMMLPSEFAKMIEEDMVKSFPELNDMGSSAAMHRRNLQAVKLNWLTVFSVQTCLVCLWYRPQYSLPCNHCICENCVRIFGTISSKDPWDYELNHCYLCGQDTGGIVVKTKPKTAGIRVLTIDGGGVRGRAPCEVLKLLEDRVGLPYPVQNNFDVGFGTSSGFIVAAALFSKGLPIEACIALFEHFATNAFQSCRSLHIPILSATLNFLHSFFKDGKYPSENLEMILRQVFSSEQTILDCSAATATGARIGVPVTTIGDASVCVFTNYNGVGVRSLENDYHVIRIKDSQAIPTLWEIARCASAAPSYFTAHHIEGLGTFQDGGLRHNNPINLAFQEIEAIYSPFEEPSLIVSLGTGSARQNSNIPWPATRGIWKDGFIQRLIRAFISSPSMSGKSVWREFQGRHRSSQKGQYFRFDIEFDGSGPRLDDTSKMTELRDMMQKTISKSSELDKLAMCIVSELFFFELEASPRNENGKYICTGHILCRLRAGTESFQALFTKLMESKFLVEEQVLSDNIGDPMNFDKTGNFYKRVCFDVHDKDYQTAIQLRQGSSSPCHISGSPFSISKLVVAQGLDAVFGRSDHVKRKRIENANVLPRKRQRT